MHGAHVFTYPSFLPSCAKTDIFSYLSLFVLLCDGFEEHEAVQTSSQRFEPVPHVAAMINEDQPRDPIISILGSHEPG